jgi:tRNA modification GTPase
MMNFENPDDTICALSTPQGIGAISLIRISGGKSFQIIDDIFSKKLANLESHTAHFGTIRKDNSILDEVVVTIFKNPHSFTGEDLIEIGCHGSPYIQAELLKLLISKGARMAGPGEFSMRSFFNGKMDLSQTEAVADVIASNSKAAHQLAVHQMRGGFSTEISALRQELMNFASLIELELDFSGEDVEFADRDQLEALLQLVQAKVDTLVASFDFGNAIKNGVPVAIVGPPNAGKSTLLNALLNEDKAIVSDIAGTTRDVIEDVVILEGVEFRFIDTAGIRETTNVIENLGIKRSYEQIKKAKIVLLLMDLASETEANVIKIIEKFEKDSIGENQKLVCLFNKTDLADLTQFEKLKSKGIFISAKSQDGIKELKELLVKDYKQTANDSSVIVTNVRHYDILIKCQQSILKIQEGMNIQITGDLLAMDIRETMNLLGEITGEISSDELLGNIFANFCIGK